MDNNKAKSVKNLIYSAVGQLITIVIGLVLPRLVIVNYGSETNGLLNSVNQFIVYLSLFEAGLGTVTLQALYGPVANCDYKSINGILSATHYHYKRTGYLYLAMLIALSVLYPTAAQSELPYFVVAGVVFFSGIGNVIMFFMQGKYRLLLQADGRNYIVTNLTTLTTVLNGVVKAILITCGYNVLHVVIASSCINLIQAAYIMGYVRKKYKWIDLKEPPKFEAISEKNYMLIHQISILILYNTDVLILTLFCDLKIVSVYSLYKLIVTQLENIISIVTGSVNFMFGQLFNVDLEKYKRSIDIYDSCLSTISFTLYTVAQSLFVPFMAIYTDGVNDINYQDGMLAFLFSINAILNTIRTPLLNTISFAGHFKNTTPQTVAEAIINLVVSLLCVKRFGIHGVLFGTLVSLIYRFVDIIIYANKKVLGRSPVQSFLTQFINFAVYAGLSIVFRAIIGQIDSWIAFALYGILFVAISIVCFTMAQSLAFPDRRKAVLKLLVGKRKKKEER